MPNLTVRHLDEDLVGRLQRRAAEHGRSAEDEHRVILEEALRTQAPAARVPRTGKELWELLSRGDDHFLDGELEVLRRRPSQPAVFS